MAKLSRDHAERHAFELSITIPLLSEWGLVLSVICPQFLLFAVKLANILMFPVFGENTV